MISVHGMTDRSNVRYILGHKLITALMTMVRVGGGGGGGDDDDDGKLGVRGGWNCLSFFHQK